ncbi:MAG: hypothetical protein ACKO04_16970 [Actinomycetes bacterium]
MTSTDGADNGCEGPGGAEELRWWAYGDNCAATVRRQMKRLRLPLTAGLVEDAETAVLRNVERHVGRNPSQTYENVARYGRRIAVNTVNRVARGGTSVVDLDVELLEEVPQAPRTEVLDSTRVHLEQLCGAAWLLAATLAFVTLTAHPEVMPKDAPQPQRGAKPVQARGWAAIWLAGLRDVFPGGGTDTRRRRRNTRVTETIQQVDEALCLALRKEV